MKNHIIKIDHELYIAFRRSVSSIATFLCNRYTHLSKYRENAVEGLTGALRGIYNIHEIESYVWDTHYMYHIVNKVFNILAFEIGTSSIELSPMKVVRITESAMLIELKNSYPSIVIDNSIVTAGIYDWYRFNINLMININYCDDSDDRVIREFNHIRTIKDNRSDYTNSKLLSSLSAFLNHTSI